MEMLGVSDLGFFVRRWEFEIRARRAGVNWKLASTRLDEVEPVAATDKTKGSEKSSPPRKDATQQVRTKGLGTRYVCDFLRRDAPGRQSGNTSVTTGGSSATHRSRRESDASRFSELASACQHVSNRAPRAPR